MASGGLPNGITQEQAEMAIAQMQQEMQSQQIQDLVRKMTDKCFPKCAKVGKGDRLDSSEQSCVAMCMDRFMDTMQVVSKAMQERSAKRM